MVCLPAHLPDKGRRGRGYTRATPSHERKYCRSPAGTRSCLAPSRISSLTQRRRPQLHWQDYSDGGYMTAVQHLIDLQSEGLIQNIGLCNFDTLRTDQICTQFGPGAIVSNQVQVSSNQRFD